MGYKPVIIANCQLDLPELNWRCSVSEIFDFSDTTPYKVFWQSEPEDISPTEAKLIKNYQFYDLILTWNHVVLSTCPNAVFFPPASLWAESDDTSQKKFAVSMLTSSKQDCPGRRHRLEVFESLPESVGDLPITKYKSPPYLPDKSGLLVPFQYSICMENAQHPNYFTEKILDAFATKTIPIYWGTDNIGDFFNAEGILQFGGYQKPRSLNDILSSLTPDFYESKKDIIEENYQKSLAYRDRTSRLVKAITDSWTPKISTVHSGEPNVQ